LENGNSFTSNAYLLQLIPAKYLVTAVHKQLKINTDLSSQSVRRMLSVCLQVKVMLSITCSETARVSTGDPVSITQPSFESLPGELLDGAVSLRPINFTVYK